MGPRLDDRRGRRASRPLDQRHIAPLRASQSRGPRARGCGDAPRARSSGRAADASARSSQTRPQSSHPALLAVGFGVGLTKKSLENQALSIRATYPNRTDDLRFTKPDGMRPVHLELDGVDDYVLGLLNTKTNEQGSSPAAGARGKPWRRLRGPSCQRPHAVRRPHESTDQGATRSGAWPWSPGLKTAQAVRPASEEADAPSATGLPPRACRVH